MHIVMAGASGLIGTSMSAAFRSAGHTVATLVRRPPAHAAEIRWDPAAGVLDPGALAGADAVVNLSGAGIGDKPWTRKRVEELFSSRLGPTRTLVHAMAQLDVPPATFISQSGSNYYGDAGSTVLREDAPAGSGTLSQICVEWEQAARMAPAGVRVVTPRTGVVFSRSGGALGKLLPLLRLGLGGPFGNGRQFWPWVTLPDVSAAFLFLLESPVSGPVNLNAPDQADINTIVAALARALHRPAVLRVPAPVLRTVMRGLGEELLLSSQRMEPAVLSSAGFQWQHGCLEDAVRWVAGKDGSA
ncbi:TIGR01777 family oxidoreductase [Pseudarthrobacter sp. BRE9]|uniref:TIGR01777 family oxidoreductase n=1 Tax=Pseudarthrobacter sp. BRE9 TaxID=2962582 RepID=UPI00288201E7|nr:TIGR01777 family oxidoreductase [Pseudarthrobacter sp. BRE9]MDT0170148.1 TIGR01777 family oxidoreductase [Pseudarthrobacter sp. BRE9]